MGSLGSRPSAPAVQQPQIIYIPSPVYQTSQTQTPSSSGGGSGATAQTPEQIAAAARTSSLLGRGRGIFGTVQTSFRGLLSLANPQSQRKTLLGE